MTNFSRDELRVVVCFAGILGLFFQLVGQTLFGAEVGQALTGAFVTLATLPVADSAFEKFRSRRDDDPPPPSPSTSSLKKPDQSPPEDDRTDITDFMAVAA